ncbi:MAG: hypothetical protein QM778_35035 [Myxococcales bacterium]
MFSFFSFHSHLKPTSTAWGLLFFALGVLAGCGDSPIQPGAVPLPQDAGPDREAEADVDAATGVSECDADDTKSCTCDDGSEGERTCTDGFYGLCKGCPTVNRIVTKCVGGVYEGRMDGTYTGGFPGVIAFYPYMLSAQSELTLLNTTQGEFATIGDGCLRFVSGDGGVIDTGAGWVTGEVDCRTGELAGILRAYYTMTDFFSGQTYKVFFKGKYTGVFNPTTKSFDNGRWTGQEPMGAINNAGGGGTWTGVLNESRAPGSGTLEGCLGEGFPENTFK